MKKSATLKKLKQSITNLSCIDGVVRYTLTYYGNKYESSSNNVTAYKRIQQQGKIADVICYRGYTLRGAYQMLFNEARRKQIGH